MITLGIDTSNYATSVAFVDCDKHNVILHKKQFLPVEQGKLGLRQQDALFHHIKNLTALFSQIKNEADFSQIKAIGVSSKPRDEENSYMPCFLAGCMCAESVGAAINVPVIYTSHQSGHITSALYDINIQSLFEKPVLMLHVSGGTTDIMLAQDGRCIKLLGSSNDLFAGQAVDRLGVKLGFEFPAGKFVSDLAEKCSENIKPKVSVHGKAAIYQVLKISVIKCWQRAQTANMCVSIALALLHILSLK